MHRSFKIFYYYNALTIALLLLTGCAVVTLPVKIVAKTVETVGDVAGGVVDVIDED